MEHFYRSLKTEWVPTMGYSIIEEAKSDIWNYIIRYYSQTRPHQHNDGLTPNQAEYIYWIGSISVTNFT